MLSFALLIMLPCAKVWSVYCKNTRQNIRNDCHQWLSSSFRVRQIRFRPRLCPPDPAGGAYSAPRPPSWFKGPTSKGMERREEDRRDGKRRKKLKWTEGKGTTHYLKFLDSPVFELRDVIMPTRCDTLRRQNTTNCDEMWRRFNSHFNITLKLNVNVLSYNVEISTPQIHLKRRISGIPWK